MRYRNALTLTLLGLLAVTIGCNSMQTSSAILRFQQGDFTLADSLCREAIKSNPDDGEAYFFLALSQSRLQNYKDAYVNFKEAARLKPDRAELAQQNIESNFATVFNDGVNAYEVEDNELAIDCFIKATDANPENPLGYSNLAKAYWSKAERFLGISLDEFLEYAELALDNFNIGLDKQTDPAKQKETAILMARVLGTLYVNDVEGRERHLSRYRELTTKLSSFYEPHEEFGKVLYDKGEELRSKRRDVEKDISLYAGEAYGKAADLRQSMNETDPNVPLWAGVAYMHADMFTESAHYLEIATQLDPNYDQAWLFLEFSLYSAGRYPEAIKAGRFLAESLNSVEPDVFRIIANCYRSLAEACDEAGDGACFAENKRFYEEAYMSYATYKGLEGATPPPLIRKEELKVLERRQNIIYEQEGIAILEAGVSGSFIRGVLLNKTGGPVSYVEISFDLKDNLGEVVGKTVAEVESVAPDREISFGAAFLEKNVSGYAITAIYKE